MTKQLPLEREPLTASDDEVQELEGSGSPGPESDEDDEDVIELPDGSAVVKGKAKPKKKETDHYDNIVEDLEPGEVSALGQDLCERIERDRESRKNRDTQYAEGQRRTGMSGDAKGGAEFDGASKVTHPMLAKGCVDFASKAIKELYPAGGPVKTQIIGKQTDEKLSRAERKREFMNWQMTTRVAENRSEFERLLSQLPLGGACYKRWWWDARQCRPRTQAVFIDDVFLPYNSADFRTAYRATHRQYISKLEFEQRVEDGLYCELEIGEPPGQIGEKSASRSQAERAEGVEEESTPYSEEGVREVYTVYADLDVEEDGEVCPYIIHVDAWSKKVLGVYRNWGEDDDQREKLDWMVEYIFIPWRGPQGIGLNHLIGSMAVASTGALRALLDSAHINNFPGGLKLKSGRTAGTSIQVNATELAEIESPAGIDDIRKLVMPFPFNGPSTVLYTLLEFLTQQAETFVATASEKIADAGQEMPVGTALALIEQGSINFSAIHARLHASLKQELAIVHRLNAQNLSDQETVEDLGELVVGRADFEGPVDVIPVSDPNIFSEAQRFAQLQAVMQLSANPSFAQFFRPDKLLRRALKLLNVSDPEDVSSLPAEPSDLDAVEENYVVCLEEPTPLKVYEDQDDYDHLLTHTHFMSSPMFGANPLIAPQALPALLTHCKDHMMALYRKHTKAAADVVKKVAKMTGGKEIPDHRAHAKGAAFSDQMLAQLLGPQVMPALTQAMQMAKALMPPPQATPDKVAEIQARSQDAAADRQQKAQQAAEELAYNKERDTLDRQSNQEASFLASQTAATADNTSKQLAAFQQQGKEKLAVLQAHLAQLDKQIEVNQAAEQTEQTQQNAMMLQMMKDQGLQQLAALDFLFQSQLAAAAPQQTKNADGSTSNTPGKPVPGLPAPGGIVAALIEGMQQNNGLIVQALGEHSQTLQTLVSGMSDLQEAQNAPRTAQFMFDGAGKKVGIRSTVESPPKRKPKKG